MHMIVYIKLKFSIRFKHNLCFLCRPWPWMLYCCTLVSPWVLQLPTLTTILNDCLLIFIKCFTYLYSPQYLELILYINCLFLLILLFFSS